MSGLKEVAREQNPRPELETEHLYLERMEADKHLDDFGELWNNQEAVMWSTKPPITKPEEVLPWMETILPNDVNPDIDKFAIILKGSLNAHGAPKMIGLVGTNRWTKEGEGVGMETGYCLNKAHWGKGYATEALKCFLKYFWTLEERKNMNTLISKTHPDNVASQRVLQKCGARRGETLVSVYERYMDNGVKSDVWCWYFDRPGVELTQAEGDFEKAKD